MSDPKPTPEDMRRAELFVWARVSQQAFALEFARVRAEERARAIDEGWQRYEKNIRAEERGLVLTEVQEFLTRGGWCSVADALGHSIRARGAS